MPFNLFSPATWFSGMGQQSPTGLFQTRTTHTPGIAGGNLPPTMAGGYDPKADPISILNTMDLTPQQKTTIAQTWAPQGSGFITIQPSLAQRSDVLRHEQLHDLQQKTGMDQYANQIAPLVSPDVKDIIKSDPQYQHEMEVYGPVQTLADEGSAIDLISMAGRAGGDNVALRNKIVEILNRRADPERTKQFLKLTARPGQSQK